MRPPRASLRRAARAGAAWLGLLAASAGVVAQGVTSAEVRKVGPAPEEKAAPDAGKAETGSARVITPGRDSSGGGRAGGPSVELITGGHSKDGTAHVGHLPVLD